ncbi:hypothetical protein NA57DRAFT_71639 [Rhizodiscina lignyota]|uniref:BRCT domain-containing protein n=1 Tax=Rhizodiscina lignyota TaxID=1504668 RepID=A0A9P4IJD4_9PEZI|nr:hypothetical protein NA57DRAFT_71639 [Rhizodiscina lignyota]
MAPLLKNYIIAATGDFGQARSHDNLRRWVEANGGKWASTVTKLVTHLIVSKDHWKRQVAAVRAALRIKQCKIVCYDWLEDSLQNKGRKREGPYLWKNKEKESAKLRAARQESVRRILKKDVRAFENGCENAKSDLMSGLLTPSPSASSKSTSSSPQSAVANLARLRAQRTEAVRDTFSGHHRSSTPASSPPAVSASEDVALQVPPFEGLPMGEKRSKRGAPAKKAADEWARIDNHHIYRDDTGFDHDVTLVRTDVANNTNERFSIRLYESHTVPHTYATATRYRHSHASRPAIVVIVDPGSQFAPAFKHFRIAFKEKTHVPWEQRYNKEVIANAVATAKEGYDRKVRVAEAEEKEVTELVRKDWERKAKVFTWCGVRKGMPKGVMARNEGVAVKGA